MFITSSYIFIQISKMASALRQHVFNINFPNEIDRYDKTFLLISIRVSPFYFLIFFQTLTSEIGTVLELKDVDKGIDDYRSTPHLTFDQYRYYLSKEVRFQ